MSMLPISDGLVPVEQRCELRARGQVVHYRRSGAGRPLLLLAPTNDEQPLWPELLDVLRPAFRLIVPDLPPVGTDVEAWLSAVIEGLGLSRVTVVASDGFCLAALERALLEPDRIARVVMICRGRGSEAAVGGALGSVSRSVPFLVLRHDRTAAEVMPLIEAFLERDGPTNRA